MCAKQMTRRTALSAGAGITATAASIHIVAPHVLGGPGKTAPSDKLNIAGVGISGMGAGNLRNMRSENIVALCDVDHARAARIFKAYPKAKVYKDYRRMLETQKDIDAVLIATPDHTHAVITLAAIQAGKHVYTQKPLTHDVRESRVLADAARASKVTTQMGIQGHSMDATRMVVEWVQQGALGEVREVDAWCSLTYYPWGHAYWSSKWGGFQAPKDRPAVPDTLDWDLWIGPAKTRPYHPAYHPAVWRCWLDFGSGMMGDRGAHTLAPVFWALGLTAPTSVDASACGLNGQTHPLASVVTYRFPARGKLPPVKLTWYEGLVPPWPPELEAGRTMGESQGGAIFHGSKAKLMCGVYGGSPRIFPESKMKEIGRPKTTIPRVRGGHEQDWIRHCKAGTKAGACFEFSGPLTETCILGNVARQVRQPIEWDAKNAKVTNVPKANDLIAPPYRKGWTLA